MDSFVVAINAVIPFVAYMLFGMMIVKTGMAEKDFLKKLNQLILKACFPVMMFYNVYNNRKNFVFGGKLVVTAVVLVLILIGLLVLLVPRFVKEDAKRGVLIQAMFRSNFVLFAFPLTQSVYGDEITGTVAVMIAVIVPLFNLFSVVVLEYYRGGKQTLLQLLKKIIQNPLIKGALVGLLFVALKIEVPSGIMVPIAKIADMTTPLALTILGGTLQFASMKRDLKFILPSMSLKLILIPMAVLALTFPLGLEGAERFILFTVFATPVAAASFPMAASMGGDPDLAGELVAFSTTVCVLTIFLWIFMMRQMAWI